MKWVFDTYEDARHFQTVEPRYNESSMLGMDENGKWFCEIFGRKDKRLFHGIGIA